MILLLTIFQYFVAAVVDVSDKFLLTKRRIEPVSYTFFSVVTGIVLLAAWPWVFQHLPARDIWLDLLSGAVFSAAMFVYVRALSQGEVSRVIPFVFGLVPVFDALIGAVTGRGYMTAREVAAFFLLVPGTLLISYKPKNFSHRHIINKILAAFLFSAYYAIWKFAAQDGNTLNNLMWNRIGASVVLIVPLAFAAYRNKVFRQDKVTKKKQAGAVFLAKQAVGGLNFVFYSWLLTAGNIAIINSLQGFRYAFLFVAGIFLSKKFKHILSEDTGRRVVNIKLAALGLIFAGTLILFL